MTYRTKEEEQYWHDRDPLIIFRERATKEELLTSEEMDSIDKATDDLIEEAVKFSDESPEPEPEELFNNVYVDYPREQFTLGAGYPE